MDALSNVTNHVRSVLPNAKPVRLVAFNKSQNENWSLPWHQDRVISLCRRESVKGYSNWSRKAGIWHCEAPVNILENMLAIRIHLDDADNQTGALEILNGSHQLGKVTADQLAGAATRCDPITCEAKIGDILMMKMLIIHRSRPSMRDAQRRAIRIDYSADILPAPLGWEVDAN